jgi:hypothetical protein
MHQFSIDMTRLEAERVLFNKAGLCSDAAKTISHEVIIRITQLLGGLKRQCECLELNKALDKVYRLEARVDSDICSYQIMMVELQELSNIIACELDEKFLAFIPTEKLIYFEQDELFGEAVNKAFPSAKNEIKDAGNCLAADLNTAAIFHLMRVAETGLRALARRLDVKIKKMPLEYADWGKIIPEIEEKIKLKKPKSRGKKQSETLEFYHGAIGEFNAFKDVWRNNVMHARGSYDEKEAIRVFNHVRGFMQRLAANISE